MRAEIGENPAHVDEGPGRVGEILLFRHIPPGRLIEIGTGRGYPDDVDQPPAIRSGQGAERATPFLGPVPHAGLAGVAQAEARDLVVFR